MSKILPLFLFVTASLLTLSAQEELPQAGRYTIAPDESMISIKAGTTGVFGFLGHGHQIAPATFDGEMDLKPQEQVPATVSIRIDATSLHETANFKPEDKKKIEGQMHGEVLETAKYPEVQFQSTGVRYSKGSGSVFNTQIDGHLTLHGITQKITVPAKVTKEGDHLRVAGKFNIARKDFNIQTKSAGGGTVKVDKTLEITFNLLLRRRP